MTGNHLVPLATDGRRLRTFPMLDRLPFLPLAQRVVLICQNKVSDSRL
jgi:hypothetical protein